MNRTYIFACMICLASQAAPGQTNYTAPQLVAAVKAARPQGDVQIRVSMKQAGKPTLQVQVRRRTAANGDDLHLYQLLFPKPRKGEGLALRVAPNGRFSGWSFIPGGKPVALTPADRTKGLFGTDVLIEDLLAEFLDWSNHTSKEKVKLGSADCTVVESIPPKAGTIQRVVSTIEDERLYPRKVEVFGSDNKLLRTVETRKVMRSKSKYYVPVEFSVVNQATGSRTDVAGVGLQDDVTFTDDDFSDAALSRGLEVPQK
jgi:hypothetical protein